MGAGQPLQLLYLEKDPELPPPETNALLPRGLAESMPSSRRCPPDMVDVRGEYCIDRYEVTLIDGRDQSPISPFYHPTRAQTRRSYERYRRDERVSDNIPPLPDPGLGLGQDPLPYARSVRGVVPQGYLNADLARRACEAAGKRLCTLAEWVTACRGQQNRKYPYGDQYVAGRCNVFRSSHPAAVLHGDPSRQHLDPRLNLVTDGEGPLLRRTGETPSCRSEWGDDAVFDMVGNLDEWVADGSFVGGFYARATREGCDARIATHAPEYFDYSIGTRCCRSLYSMGPRPAQ